MKAFKPKFFSTKTYDHNEGLSCVFRQWRADGTHCRFLHGYALKFRIVFGCEELDERNWVQHFGGLKEFKAWLHHMFDHTLLIAEDDPQYHELVALQSQGLAQVRVFPAVGCEMVAKAAFDWLDSWLYNDSGNRVAFAGHDSAARGQRVWVESVEVAEHAGNSAIYGRDYETDHATKG